MPLADVAAEVNAIMATIETATDEELLTILEQMLQLIADSQVVTRAIRAEQARRGT